MPDTRQNERATGAPGNGELATRDQASGTSQRVRVRCARAQVWNQRRNAGVGHGACGGESRRALFVCARRTPLAVAATAVHGPILNVEVRRTQERIPPRNAGRRNAEGRR